MVGIDYSSICVAFQSASEPSECGECLHDCVTRKSARARSAGRTTYATQNSKLEALTWIQHSILQPS
jgi:hypothetical protein